MPWETEEHATMLGNQPAPYRGLAGPPGLKCRKSLQKYLSGPPAPAPQKSLPKVPGTLQKHSPDTFRRLSGDLPDCPRDSFGDFLVSRGRRPRETFSRLFRHFGPFDSPGDLCKGRAGSQKNASSREFYCVIVIEAWVFVPPSCCCGFFWETLSEMASVAI